MKDLCQRPFPIKLEGGKRIRRRHITKGQLIAIYNEGGIEALAKLKTEVREGADDVIEGVPYEIVEVEELTTDVQRLAGIRVTLMSANGEQGNTVLWQRPITGLTSKLGVFITLLGDETDEWLHKWIVLRVWQNRNRVMEVVPAPSPKAPKAKSKKAT